MKHKRGRRQHGQCVVRQRSKSQNGVLWGLSGALLVAMVAMAVLVSDEKKAPSPPAQARIQRTVKPSLPPKIEEQQEQPVPDNTPVADVKPEYEDAVVLAPTPKKEVVEVLYEAKESAPDLSSDMDTPNEVNEADDQEPTEDKDENVKEDETEPEPLVDMNTRTLLFTTEAQTNDDNLSYYLDQIETQYETGEYDEEAAERSDDERKVK